MGEIINYIMTEYNDHYLSDARRIVVAYSLSIFSGESLRSLYTKLQTSVEKKEFTQEGLNLQFC